MLSISKIFKHISFISLCVFCNSFGVAQGVNFTAKTISGKTIKFYDASTDIDASEWFWNFGDGNVSNEQNPVHTFASPGVYQICLKINNEFVECKNDTFKITNDGIIVKFDETQWPNGDVSMLSSPFGPRYKISEDRYDYHRGIDIPGENGDPVYNIADGIVYGIYIENQQNTYSSTVVVVKHQMDTPILFHGVFITTYYSLSMHLNEVADGLQEGDEISIGDLIGAVGQTGPTTFNHNHLEIRLGVVCSKESQEDGFCQYKNPYEEPTDPHVNPLLFLDYENYNINSLTYKVTSNNPLTIQIISDRPELDFNEIIISHNGQEKNININERVGIDPDDIDNDDYEDVFINPSIFSSEGGEDYIIEFQFDDYTEVDDVKVKDIWGNIGVKNITLSQSSITEKPKLITKTEIELTNFFAKYYKVSDFTGKTICKGDIINDKVTFKKPLEQGFYILTLYSLNEIYNFKFIIN